MLGTETVTVAGEVEYDDDNDPIPGTGGQTTVGGCLVEPLDGTDIVDLARSGTTCRVRVHLPITVGVSGDSVLTVRGRPFRVVGDPVAFIDPEDTELSGYVVVAESVQGV